MRLASIGTNVGTPIKAGANAGLRAHQRAIRRLSGRLLTLDRLPLQLKGTDTENLSYDFYRPAGEDEIAEAGQPPLPASRGGSVKT